MCGIFEFWWNNFFMGMKFDFKFQNWETFYKGFPCKKKIPREFYVKWKKIRFKEWTACCAPNCDAPPLTTTATAVVMDRPTSRPPDQKRFSDFAQKMWKKIRFKFEKSEKIYKRFPRKKNYMGILYKMNADQNYMEFLL